MRSSFSLGALFLRIALAFLLIVTGIWGITGGTSLFNGIAAMLTGSIRTIVVISISIAALIAGVLLLLELFGANFPIVDLILLIFIVLWIIQMFMSILGSINTAFSSANAILNFLYMVANNLLILSALIICQRKLI